MTAHHHSMTQAFYTSGQGFVSTTARLFCISGPLSGTSFPLTEEVDTIGRLPDNAVCLNTAGVSKRHCALRRGSNDCYVIEDSHSRNGTEVNGRRLVPGEPLQLSHGDRITLADTTLFFLQPKSTAEATQINDIQIDRGAATAEAAEFLANCPALTDARRRRRAE